MHYRVINTTDQQKRSKELKTKGESNSKSEWFFLVELKRFNVGEMRR